MIKTTLLLVCTCLLACQTSDRTNKSDNDKTEKMNISRIVHEATDMWINKEGVTAVAIGEKDGKECIQVLLSLPVEEVKIDFPKSFRGIPVEVMNIGEVHIQKMEEE